MNRKGVLHIGGALMIMWCAFLQPAMAAILPLPSPSPRCGADYNGCVVACNANLFVNIGYCWVNWISTADCNAMVNSQLQLCRGQCLQDYNKCIANGGVP